MSDQIISNWSRELSKLRRYLADAKKTEKRGKLYETRIRARGRRMALETAIRSMERIC